MKDPFWLRINKSPSCWLWFGAVGKHGYGNVNRGGKTWRAHRLAWSLVHGQIPSGKFVLHRCDNPLCCNPAHLFVGSHADNMRDMREKGRSLTGDRSVSRRPGHTHKGERHWSRRLVGEANPNTRISDKIKRAIFVAYEGGSSQYDVAAVFGVSQSHVSRIVALARKQGWA